MFQHFGPPSLDGDVDMEVAELSVTAVLRFAQWSQGNAELIPALGCVAELFGASRCALVRINPNDMKAEFVGAAESGYSESVAPRVEIFAPRILASDVRRLSDGDIRFLSRMSQLPFRLSGGVDEELSRREIEDLAFVCLEVGQRGIVLLEVQYARRPNSACRRIVEWIVPKLQRAYRPGKGRRIDDEITGNERQTAAGPTRTGRDTDPPILGMENPSGLTRSEWRVCELASRGLSAKSIAYELGVTGNTVRTHLRHIYAKVDVTGYYELVYKLISQSGDAEFVRMVNSR